MKQEDALLHLRSKAEESSKLHIQVVEQLGPTILQTVNLMSGVIGSGGKILVAGNGGSASMASHLAAEMIVRLSSERNRQSLPCIALAADLSIITAAANDFGYENVFARQVEGLGNKGDMLMVMTTSGNSENLVRAVTIAKQKNMLVTGLLGGDGGKLAPMIEQPIIIPHRSTQRIQEEHLFIVHQLVELVERDLFA
ncbi:SIS domain-containing protein [candidate division GN15 bacterium]|nr:SIS domain-containing protein [candidate division GN15 bacterium]